MVLFGQRTETQEWGRPGSWKQRSQSPGLGLEVASVSLAREKSQESCRERPNSCYGLWELRWKPQSKWHHPNLSLIYLASWVKAESNLQATAITTQLAQCREHLTAEVPLRKMGSCWRSGFNKCCNILNSSFLFLALGGPSESPSSPWFLLFSSILVSSLLSSH